jgi:hypothetical protein
MPEVGDDSGGVDATRGGAGAPSGGEDDCGGGVALAAACV